MAFVPRRKSQDGHVASNMENEQDGMSDISSIHDVENTEAQEFLRRPSNIDRMEGAATVYGTKARSLMEITCREDDAIDRDILRAVIEVNKQRFYRCLSLPFSIMLFFIFAGAAYLHEDINNVYIIESGLRTELTMGLEEVNSIEDVWAWLGTVLVPKLFHQTDMHGLLLPNKQDWGHVLEYNIIQGPLMLEQLRSEIDMCHDGEGIAGDMICYPFQSASMATFGDDAVAPAVTQPLPTDYPGYTGQLKTTSERQEYYQEAFSIQSQQGRRLRMARPEYIGKLPGGVPDGDAFSAFIYPNTPKHLIQEHLTYLISKGWLDAQTKQLTLKALMVNGEVGRPRLLQYKTTMHFSRGGGVFSKVQIETVFLRMHDGVISILADMVLVCMLIFETVKETRALWKAKKAGEFCTSLKQFGTLLHWLIIVWGWVCILTYLAQESLRRALIQSWQDARNANNLDLPAEDNALGATLHGEADWVSFCNQWFRIIIGEYHVVLMVRFFTAFHAQPRLAVVTSTLEKSFIDIIHFLLVLMPTFFAYAMSGCLLFGKRIEQFATIQGSVGVCFRILMEGEYDWPDLSEEHTWTSGFWVWTFMFLLVMLMLNMVLAIILDVYTEMRKKSGQSETVWETVMNYVAILSHYRTFVAWDDLLEGVPLMQKWVTREDLEAQYPTMCKAQMKMIIKHCKVQNDLDNGIDGVGKMEWQKMLMAEKLLMDKINECLNELNTGLSEESDIPAEQHGWLGGIAKDMAAQNHLMLQMQWRLQQLEWQWEAAKVMHGADVTFDEEQVLPKEEEDCL